MAAMFARLARPLGIVFLVVLAVVVVLSIAAIALLVLGGIIGGRVSSMAGVNKITWAIPGVAFRAPPTRSGNGGWRAAYVIANKNNTYVLSALKGGFPLSDGQHNGIVTLADANGHTYDEQPDADVAPLPDASGQYYQVTIFPPLHAGTAAVLVRHNVRGGATVRIPVSTTALPATGPVRLNMTRAVGRVRVTVAVVTRGALLSQVDLDAQGFADPGGEQTRSGPNSISIRPSQMPSSLTMHTASGADLAPQVGQGPVDKGVVTMTVGFRTPPRGVLVTLRIDNFELLDLPPGRRTTHGRWVFTFRMP